MSLERHYRILGVGEDVDVKTLKKVYRSLIRKNHPDVSHTLNAEEITINIIEAYETILANLLGTVVNSKPAWEESPVPSSGNSVFEFNGEVFDIGIDLSIFVTADIREKLDRIAQIIHKPTFVGDYFNELYHHVTEVSSRIKHQLKSSYNQSDIIAIQDEMIELVTRVYLGNVSSTITFGDLESITELDLSSLNLESISDLRHYTQLEMLDLSDATIDQLVDLSEITQIKQLYAAGCASISLDDVAKLRYLELLDLAGHKIADTEPLAQLTCLTELILYDNNIVHLDSIGTLDRLRRLDVSLNPIKDLSSLRKLSNLEYLNLNWTRVEDFTPMLDITSLRFVDISYYSDAVLERNSWIWELLRQRGVFVKTDIED